MLTRAARYHQSKTLQGNDCCQKAADALSGSELYVTQVLVGHDEAATQLFATLIIPT